MNFYIIAVSKHQKDASGDITAEYQKRIKGGFRLSIINIKPPSESLSESEQKKREKERIFAALPKERSYIVACDETGKPFSTAGFAKEITRLSQSGVSSVVFIIGGAFGLDSEVLEQCNMRLSLSQFTLAHRVALVVLAEQLYRVYTIFSGHPYSK